MNENKIIFLRNVRRIFGEFYVFFGPLKLFICILGTFITVLFAVIEPFFMEKTISLIENFYNTKNFNVSQFLFFLSIWAIFIIVYNFLEYIRRYYLSDKPALEFHNFFSKKYVDNIYYATLQEYLSKKSGGIFKDFDRGATSAFQIIFFILGTASKALFLLLCTLVILFYYNWKMAILALIMLPFMGLVGYFVNQKTSIPQKENEKKWTQAFSFVGDFLSSFQLGKILHLENKFKTEFNSEINEALRLQKLTSRWWSISDMITSSFTMISRFLVICGGVYFIWKGELTIAGLLLVFSYLHRIYFPLSSLFGSLPNLQQWDTRIGQFYENFEKVTKENLNKGEYIEKKLGDIFFKNINFSYNSERKILNNLSFVVKKGQKIALVGNTGAGKSTIVSLLFRFWEPDSGEIWIGDQNIENIKKSSLRSVMGMVSQDNSLFNISIKENLLLAKPDANDDEIRKALKNASADFVYSLEKGIDTVIGERGLKLSGGEKQRISIARLFLQNPEILVLDEATSALDNKTEKNIQKSLDKLMKNKTSIIIAHRLSTIQNVDNIFMIENGKIVEQGRYDELIKKGGKFAELASAKNLIIS